MAVLNLVSPFRGGVGPSNRSARLLHVVPKQWLPLIDETGQLTDYNRRAIFCKYNICSGFALIYCRLLEHIKKKIG